MFRLACQKSLIYNARAVCTILGLTNFEAGRQQTLMLFIRRQLKTSRITAARRAFAGKKEGPNAPKESNAPLKIQDGAPKPAEFKPGNVDPKTSSSGGGGGIGFGTVLLGAAAMGGLLTWRYYDKEGKLPDPMQDIPQQLQDVRDKVVSQVSNSLPEALQKFGIVS